MVSAESRDPGLSLGTLSLIDLGVVLCVALVVLGLWSTSTKFLLASSGGHERNPVLTCTYFTGIRIVERQYIRTAGEGVLSCPLVKVGRG